MWEEERASGVFLCFAALHDVLSEEAAIWFLHKNCPKCDFCISHQHIFPAGFLSLVLSVPFGSTLCFSSASIL